MQLNQMTGASITTKLSKVATLPHSFITLFVFLFENSGISTMTFFKWARRQWRFLVFVLTPMVLCPLAIVTGTREGFCGYVGLVMAVYWVLEILPLAVTSLLPIVLFPLFQIMPTKDVTPYYMKDTIVLFMGGN